MGTTRPKPVTAAERRVNELERLIAKRDADIVEMIDRHHIESNRMRDALLEAERAAADAARERDTAMRDTDKALTALASTSTELGELQRLDAEGLAFARCVGVLDPLQQTRYAGGIGPTTGVVDNAPIERVLRMLALRYSIDLPKAGA